ncbi:DHA2 family efflux MFS transporter permease subunit [Lentzea aerocolonigenes]|uniref:DHA2 family efflux MFS transporter permease subunit n=1 Tax=Lentzea aerocolonigenes TaxID=68170 RepID=UPI0004C458BE|nr:DHA2 family efflux MFS transporter permease subunit [Lentzea aerocolonigenes]MCP2248801.1 drug resistance transporter, EmrB/QacA subfamily [Lentzea aerocolonigenes]
MSRRGGLAVFVLTGAASFMAALDNLVVTTALPQIRQDLGADLESLEWTVHSYTMTFAVFMLAAAVLGDRYGRRTVLLAGVSVFTAASALAAMSTSTGVLLAARALQGLGGSVIFPLSLTVLVHAVPPARRGLAIAGLSVANGLAIALGPFVGGVAVQLAGWHWIFWINVPIGLLVVPFGARLLAQSRGPQARLDVTGTVLVTLALLGPVYGLVRSVSRGWLDPQVLLPLLAGVVFLAAFVAWERRAVEPVVPLRLFRSRGFRLTSVVALLVQAGMFGSIFLIMQFFQDVLHYSPLGAGVRTLPWTVMPLLVAPLSAVLADRWGVRPLMVLSCAMQAGVLAWLALVVAVDMPYLPLLPAMVVGGVGMGLFFGLNARQALEFVSDDDRGVASGVNHAMRQVGVVLGVAVLATVFSAFSGGARDGAHFVAGISPALLLGCGVLSLATVAAIATPATRRAAGPGDPDPGRAGTSGDRIAARRG